MAGSKEKRLGKTGPLSDGPMNKDPVGPVTKEENIWKRCGCLLLMMMTSYEDFGTLTRTKAGFSYAMVLMDNTRGWYGNGDTDEEGGSMVDAKLATYLRIFSKAVKNNWSPPYGEERRERPIHDVN